MYVDDLTTLYLIAVLKAYGVRHIVASPGAQNAGFNLSVQNDADFDCVSVVDERSAAYVATGIAFETGRPVVITCTGATASRNYLSAMTEAYYRHLPIIAITFQHNGNRFNLEPQFLDRSVSQNDVKVMSVELPVISNGMDKAKVLSYLNAAMASVMSGSGPVHINVINTGLSFNTPALPTDAWTTKIYHNDFASVSDELSGKRVGIFIGNHKKFTPDQQRAISDFAVAYDAPVFCDHSSNYHGENKILVARVTQLSRLDNDKKPQIIIDIGDVTSVYTSENLFHNARYWRVSQDGKYHSRYNRPVEKLFLCNEYDFFTGVNPGRHVGNGYVDVVRQIDDVINTPPILPLCNALVCKNLAKYMPANSTLHMGLSNSKRNMNFFYLDETISVCCNTGCFGIDGNVSTMVGQSLADANRMCFGIVGDLTFFYDMNVIGIRHIKSNFRLVLINNNRGEEFRLNPILEDAAKNDTDILVAAHGHNGDGVRGWAQSCGFHYMTTSTSDDIEKKIKQFCTGTFDRPVIFEIFTTNEDEQSGLAAMCAGASGGMHAKKKNLFQRLTRKGKK